jgi:prepilin signal peptidase PulO-like enzyme (type II secretory pathway)
MTKDIEIPKLTEGDWITKDITLDGNIICKKKKVGLEIEDLERLKALYSKGKIRKVTIKNGFPFIPSFLIGSIAYLFLVDMIFNLLSVLF